MCAVVLVYKKLSSQSLEYIMSACHQSASQALPASINRIFVVLGQIGRLETKHFLRFFVFLEQPAYKTQAIVVCDDHLMSSECRLAT